MGLLEVRGESDESEFTQPLANLTRCGRTSLDFKHT